MLKAPLSPNAACVGLKSYKCLNLCYLPGLDVAGVVKTLPVVSKVVLEGT